MIANIQLRQELKGFAGHTIRIYRGRYTGPRSPKGKRRTNWLRFIVTIDSTNLEDPRWQWEETVSRSAAVALLEVAGYQWEEDLRGMQDSSR